MYEYGYAYISISLSLYIYIYIYIYTFVYTVMCILPSESARTAKSGPLSMSGRGG